MSFEKRNLEKRRPSACKGNAILQRTIYRDVRDRPSVVHEPYARRETTRARTERPRRHPGPTGGWIGTESQKRNPCMHVSEESNIGIVPANRPNKGDGNIAGGGGGGKAGDQGERYGT